MFGCESTPAIFVSSLRFASMIINNFFSSAIGKSNRCGDLWELINLNAISDEIRVICGVDFRPIVVHGSSVCELEF